MRRWQRGSCQLFIASCVVGLFAAMLLSGCGPAAYRWINERYVVRPGDTLYSVAFSNDLDFHDVARWNHIEPPYTVYPGETLRLTPPPNATTVAEVKSPAVSQRSQPAPVRNAAKPPHKPRKTDTQPSPATASTTRQSKTEPTTAAAITWRWPVKGAIIKTSDSPIAPKGINIAGHVGEAVRATAAGKVVYSGDGLKGYGRLIIIKHNQRYLSAYGDNSKLEVQEGDHVKQGQVIALMGLGPGRRPMLHFEIRRDGKPLNPLRFLQRSD